MDGAPMTKNTREDNFDLATFVDFLTEDLFLQSDEKVLADAIEDFGSIEQALGNLDAEIDAAINDPGKQRLAEARAAFVESCTPSLRPTETTEAFRQLAEQIISDPQFKKITLAARNGRSGSGGDALSIIQDLCELRLLKRSTPIPKFGRLPKADAILQDLGITRPEEIDVEAIAWALGAKVRYGGLTQCEARIVGTEDTAIITVDKNVPRQRQRFSVCHEIGHWIYHRGQALSCQAGDIELPSGRSNSLERVADRFASELLMPSYIFAPIAESLGKPTMKVVEKLSELFGTSRTATAIRLVELNKRPLCLVNHGTNGRHWFARSHAITGTWMPRSELSADSNAFSVVFGKSTSVVPKCVNASVWFTPRDAARFHVIEDSHRVQPNEVLTLLSIQEEKEFLDQFG
jgi:IrrE N-terminal-like domain